MEMTNSGLSASDVLAMTRDNDGFGGVGLIILLFIFLIGLSGSGFGFGGGNAATAFSLSDIQSSLYNQSQDMNSRQTQNQIAMVNDTVLNNKYDNAILIKDLSNQLSNSVAGIGSLIQNQTATITDLFNQQTIESLRDKLATTRDELSNVRQTGILTSAINNQTSEILNTQGRYYLNPPCYNGCGCGSCNGLY